MVSIDSNTNKLIRLIPNISTVLFDFDGILVDSEYHYFLACQQALRDFGMDIDETSYYDRWTIQGIGLSGELQYQQVKLNPDDFCEMENRRYTYYRSFCRQGKILFIPGMVESISIFIRLGLKVAIASNTLIDIVDLIFFHSGQECPCIKIGRIPGLRPKPESDIFLYAAGTLQSAPTECLIIEDAHKGIAAAQKVCMKTMLIRPPHGIGSSDDSNIDIIFNNYSEYRAAIGQLI